ncbi:hypothetical protein FZEAL_9134 [Fusarium zealandicum]|uniref:Ankyrin n=1 Tax=Fusarium zealandicum TaxID=1053134 RepID=A0A8H4XG57_9HYPO|nr:hypothetical protein FZEAL_9134 [Fusarium zealandicum]
MLARIRCLRESALEACATINASHSKNSPPAARSGVKPLIVELRLLGGALYSFESLIDELTEGTSDTPVAGSDAETPEWPLIDGCELLITALKSFHSFADLDGLRAARASLLDHRSKLAFLIGSSETLQDVSLQLSILGSDPIPQLMGRRKAAEAVESPAQVRSGDEPSPEEISAWLTLLNSPEHDREPAEYNQEAALVQSRRATCPNYRTAATRWPKFAEKHWQKLRPQICTLFRVQRLPDQTPPDQWSFSFAQWVLEFARETFPRTFGPAAVSPRLLLELTDALCDGSVSSLHIAAALGLPSLCRDLLSMGANVNQPSILGTPLFCSLVGTKVLATRAEPDSWSSLLVGYDSDVDQAATVLLLLDKGADCSYRYHWKNADEVSLAGLAFWAALTTKHENIFTRIVMGGCCLDGAFALFLRRNTLINRAMLHQTRFAHLLTYVYDLTLSRNVESSLAPTEEQVHESLGQTVSHLMLHTNVKFSFSESNGKITTLDDESIAKATRYAVLESNVILMERLTSDPRFNPNLSYDKRGQAGTILHMASEGSQLGIMDILIGAGADIQARDSMGRTPIMVVEAIAPLARLVLVHNASTLDRDNDGRTIWHLAAFTNDVDILKWLWENDPHKQRNIGLTSRAANPALLTATHTPLIAAFSYISTLSTMPRVAHGVAPKAARFLLEVGPRDIAPGDHMRLVLYGIEWGDLCLLENLFKIIPRSTQLPGWLWLSLNLSASDDLVTLVLDRCGPLHYRVAETVILNTKLIGPRPPTASSPRPKPTAHPSCSPQMTRSTYERLLTPAVLASRDPDGRGLWSRFCRTILPMLSGTSVEHHASLQFLSDFICMALSCLVKHGAHTSYEEETGEWALLCMARTAGDRPQWQPWQFPFVTAIMEALPLDGTIPFLDSFEAALLLREAIRLRQTRLVEELVRRGVKISKMWDGFLNLTLLEYLISYDALELSLVSVLLAYTEPEELEYRQFEILDRILEVPDEPKAVVMFTRLVQWGMDPNYISEAGLRKQARPVLPQAICLCQVDVACALLENGADPAFCGPDGYNALLAAADLGSVAVVEEVIERVGFGFDWVCHYERSGVYYNALQLAARKGHRDVLEILLQSTPLGEEVDSATAHNSLPPAHLAAKFGFLECLKTLRKFGADLAVRDASGRTPLFWALLGGKEEVAEYLKDSLPDYDVQKDDGISTPGPLEPVLDSEASELISRTPGRSRSESKVLGKMIADMLLRHRPGRVGLFASLLKYTSKDELEAAIMPCNSCTLLSYTAAKSDVGTMIELLGLGFRGFVASCSEHWPVGYNALVDACLHIRGFLRYDFFTAPEQVYPVFSKCLDGYLAEGRLWFHVPTPPIHVICQYQKATKAPDCIRQMEILGLVLGHLVVHADEYWTLLEKSGLSGLSEPRGVEDIKARLLRLVLNTRSEVNIGTVYLGGSVPTALHVLIESCGINDATVPDMEPFCNMARMLLSHGADVNAQDIDLYTPLHLAASYGMLPMVDLLLKASADAHARDVNGIAPLGHAVFNRKTDVVRCLIQYGADPQTFSGLDDSRMDLKLLHELLGLGMDPCTPTMDGHSVIASAISWGGPSRSYALNGDFDFCRILEQDPFLLTRLVRHQRPPPKGLKAVLRRIPGHYHDQVVNFAPPHELGPGCFTISLDRADLLELLVNFGFDYEREWCDKGSALMFAGSIGASRTFKMLVRCGARLSYTTKDRHGWDVTRSVVEATRIHPKLLQWLFVDRHYETKYVEWEAHGAPFTRPWSGPRRAEYNLVGNEIQYGRLDDESTIEYLGRLARIRRDLTGKIVPVTLVG